MTQNDGQRSVWARCAECDAEFRRLFVGDSLGPDTCPACLAPVVIEVACKAALGCMLEDGHALPHLFDVSEKPGRLGLADDPAAVVLNRLGAQMMDAGAVLRSIARELAAGLALWPCDCDNGDIPGGVCRVCGGKRGA